MLDKHGETLTVGDMVVFVIGFDEVNLASPILAEGCMAGIGYVGGIPFAKVMRSRFGMEAREYVLFSEELAKIPTQGG